ncbi:hypothetical protein EVAR_41768_1 [Eumeta japonica]|uniref:Uncharacterized protein n=1 Tax=Eumeta variegata TaxID=151549 RepID=A0A4C1W037_EUMVA|nr:hypothetical protein EVAR_41768_1 [Eumeta japonica]
MKARVSVTLNNGGTLVSVSELDECSVVFISFQMEHFSGKRFSTERRRKTREVDHTSKASKYYTWAWGCKQRWARSLSC